MSFVSSNSLMDVVILSIVFALIVLLSPASAAIDCSITTGPIGYKGVVYQPSYPAGVVPLYDSLPGIAYNAPITITCNGSTGLVDEYYTPDNDPPTYIGGRVLCTGCSQASTNVPWSGRYRYRIGMNGNGQPIFWYAIGGASGAPTAAFSGTPTSGAVPLAVQFTSTSTGLGTLSYLWDFGDGDNTNSTAQNPLHVYSSSGTYTVNLTVSSIYGTDSELKSSYITVSAVPVASFTCSPINTTSPDTITCTDSTTGIPTGWLWQLTSFGVSMSPGGSYGAGIYSAVNSTQNPVFSMSGSGTVDVRLTASNAFGSSQEYKPAYITISGVAPTPTPTPNIPWPNQTGVCQHSAISLGSGYVQPFNVHYQLTDPQSDTFSGQYLSNQTSVVSGYPFFTALLGQYVYNEYSMVDGTLLWRQSYVVEDCTVTPTVTATATATQTPFPTFTYTNVPTVPIPISTIDWTGAEPDTPLDFNVTIPQNITFPEVPATLPTISPIISEMNIINQTCDNSSVLASIFCPITVSTRETLSSFNTILLNYLIIPVLSPVVMILTMGVDTMSDFQGMIGLWNVSVSIFRGLIWNAFMSIPPKALNALCVPLVGEILKEVIDWPREVEKK